MNFKFSLKYYQLSLFFVWFIFLSRAVYLMIVTDRSFIFFELILSAVITQLSVGSFLHTAYKYKMVRFINVFKIAAFVYLNLNYLSIADNIDSAENSFFQFYFINPDYVIRSLLTIIIGMLALDFADLLFRLKLKKLSLIKSRITFSATSNLVLKRKNLFIIISYIYLFILIVMVATGISGYADSVENIEGAALGPFSAVLQFYGFLAPMIILSYLAVVFLNKDKDLRFNRYFKIFFILYIFSTLYAGSKGPVIIICIQLLLFYLAAGNKFPKVIVLVAIPIVLLVFPVVTQYRDQLRTDTGKSRLELLGNAVNSTITGSEKKSESNESTGKALNSRLSMFNIFVYSVENEQLWTEYKHMDRYPYLPVSFVPRQLIPSKPTSDIGAKLNYMVLGLLGSSVTPTTFGWAYFEGGEVYVFISFFLLGCFLSYIQYYLPTKTPFYFVYSLVTLFNMITVENDIYFMIAGQLISIFVCLVFVKIFFKNERKDVTELVYEY
ncbi:oligosaccharide repeat unit polymerase [Halpernia frigidisoli]|uniref:Oligosaccharide repeat unit polymerase n=1 Tax=Halpernia frigidisoli TaxID=1125876 RepID=A0A1I3FD56_9FLAO|nr:oligosaccharide repeat unit polymerase [Halpernia frigidisoli]SFI09119.1 hypothetical protein SAMN05443292_1298 [Halpernia frigidisoli]